VRPAIERLQRAAAEQRGLIPLAGGLPSTRLFPRRALGEALARALSDPQAALQYGWPEGRRTLRAWIAERLSARGLRVAPDEVIVTSGAQQALAIACELCAARGAEVQVDAESYPAALDLFRGRGLRPHATPRARALRYAMPALSNPRGRALDAVERARLARDEAPLIEDDAYAELRFDGRTPEPIAARARARVWHVGSFSKTLCPGLRVGWLVPPPRMRERALRKKRDGDLQASSLGQAVLERFLERDDFAARLARARAFYRARAEKLARAVERRLPGWRFRFPDGGFSLWVEADEPGDDELLLERAVERGVSFDPGRLFRAGGRCEPLALRLCFSSAPVGALDEGVRRLGRAWDALRRARDREPRRAAHAAP
jgi:2-aminoadipate transaminase